MPKPSAQGRFWTKVDKRADGCWIWTAALDAHGYGSFHINGRTAYAYHVAFEWLVGPRPAGMDLDHLCRDRRCVNPAHLEAVTRGENLHRSPLTQTSINAAKTHCVNDHEFTPANTIIDAGFRRCRTCKYAANARARLRRRALVGAAP